MKAYSDVSNLYCTKIGPNLVRNETIRSLNEIVKIKRQTVMAPVPRYAYSEQSEIKSYDREGSFSLSLLKDELSLHSTKHESEEPSLKLAESPRSDPNDGKELKEFKLQSKSKNVELTFDNEGGDLSTRCDVVYKTILRDFRRFYLDSFKNSTLQASIKEDLAESLLRFTRDLFPEKSSSECKSISLDLG